MEQGFRPNKGIRFESGEPTKRYIHANPKVWRSVFPSSRIRQETMMMTPQELHTFLVQAQLWVGVFILGMFAQFARLLTGKYDKLTTVNIIFGGIGAGIASVSVVSILLATHLVPASFAIGISGIVGWMGGNVMTAVGVAAEHWFNKKFGTDIKVDDDKEDKK